MRKSLWSPDEDERLKHYVAKHGCGNWSDVAKQTGLKRCGKSCRLRWINYLRPDLKRGPFTPDEIRLIVNLHRDLGNSWSRIATYLPGRTDNDVKNFWHSYTRSKRMQTLPPAAVSITEASKNQPAKPIATHQRASDKSSSASEPPAYTNQMKFPANSAAQLDTALQSSRSVADSLIERSLIKPSTDHYSGLVLMNDVQVCPTSDTAAADHHQFGEVEEVIDCGHIDYDRQYLDHGHVLISQVSDYPPSALMSIDHLHDQYNGSCVNDGINLPSLCFAVHEQYCSESDQDQYSMINPPEDLQSVLWSFMHRSNYRQALTVLPSPSSSSSASHSSASSGNSCSSDRKPVANYLKSNSGDNHDAVASNHAVLHTAPYAMLVDFR